MIEAYVLLTLAGIGFLLNRNNSIQEDNRFIVNRNELPSMNTAYDSTFYNKVNELEKYKASKSHISSLNPQKTGVISPMFRENVVKSNLAGVNIPAEQFTHNNMTPYFGGSVRQNTSANANKTIMENFTGTINTDTYIPKQEVKPMFQVEKDACNVFGNMPQTDYMKDRIFDPLIRNNERPFEPIHVGPGLNAGFSSKPVGGFQQFDTRDYAMPKNIDELRTADNPKLSYEGRVLPGQGIAQRGKLGEISKNRPDTFYENNPDKYFTTTGAFTKPKERPCVEAKETNRQNHKEYIGGAHAYDAQARTMEEKVKASQRQQLEDFGIRNAALDDYGKGCEYDYGKGNVVLGANERDNTATRTYEGNLTSLVKSIIAPIEDIFKNTRKEYIVQNPRLYGQMQTTFPDKLTIYDPNDVARTTIKETNIHDSVEANLKGPVKISVYDPDEIAKTTIRQTTRPMDTQLNIRRGRYGGESRDPYDTTKTTMKETTIDAERYGNIEGTERERGAYEVVDYDAPLTQRQFTSDQDYTGIVNKENGDGYLVAETYAPETQKQFLSDNDYYGGAGAQEDKKPKSYEDIYNATLNELREGTLVKRSPVKESVKMASGMDTVNMSHKKLICDTYTERQNNNINHIVNEPKKPEEINVTKYKDILESDDRLDINILSPLKDNPYANKSFA